MLLKKTTYRRGVEELSEQFQDKIRFYVKEMIKGSGGGHAGGSLSMAEILASLYEDVMTYDPKNKEWEERDRFILSKGHSGLGLYAALYLAGYIPEDTLYTFGKADGSLMNHPDRKAADGIEVSTGSLGHGLSIAVGMALAAKKKREKQFVYCLLGDAEIQEGSVWEAAMAASAYKLNRLVVIIDRNYIGNDGSIDTIVSPEPLEDKWTAFGFKAVTVNGHDRKAITEILLRMKEEACGPYAVIAETEKGHGLIEGLAGTGAAHYIKGKPDEIEQKFICV